MKIIKCAKCRKDKQENEFSLFHNRLNKSCTQCRNYHNNFYKTNAEGYRDKRKLYYLTHKKQHKVRAFKNNLKRKYGISVELYQEMLKAQNNKCKVCGTGFEKINPDRIPQVDHCHKTGKVRGLICRNCNLRLIPAVEWYLKYQKQIVHYLRAHEVEDKEPLQ
jgi:hypothetical protein